MPFSETLFLGVIAGITILLGLPIGRLKRPAPTLRVVLSAIAVGVLLFLLWDVLSAAWEPIDSALSEVHEQQSGLSPVLGYGALFVGGLAAGLLGLVAYDRSIARLGHRTRHAGPGAAAAPASAARSRRTIAWSPARRLAFLIAAGIGLHNFAEGLAIGQASASGAITLATVLVIGFALHNATEGFGIVAPLAGDNEEARPGWGFLLGMAAIGGGPTLIGTIVGYHFTSEPVSVVFLTLAAGSILYVIAQLLGVVARAKRTDLVAYGIFIGIIAGFITDAIVTAGGV